MRNVTRTAKPKSLSDNADKWTKDLLAEIKRAKKSGKKIPDSFYSKYNKADVKEALKKMYGRRCCFCESSVKATTKAHIEHRKPKKGEHAFPELTYEWSNLHLVCPICNSAKGAKWNTANEILDAENDVPISDHLTYELDEEKGVLRSPLTSRGQTTVDDADLNRQDLAGDARSKILYAILKLIKEINDAPDSPRSTIVKDKLEAKKYGDYGSLVEWTLANYG